jgi:hypothetical protein
MTDHEETCTAATPPPDDLADPPGPHYLRVTDARADGWTRPDRHRDAEIVPPGRAPTGDEDHARWSRRGFPSTPVLIWTPVGWVAHQMFPPGLR